MKVRLLRSRARTASNAESVHAKFLLRDNLESGVLLAAEVQPAMSDASRQRWPQEPKLHCASFRINHFQLAFAEVFLSPYSMCQQFALGYVLVRKTPDWLSKVPSDAASTHIKAESARCPKQGFKVQGLGSTPLPSSTPNPESKRKRQSLDPQALACDLELITNIQALIIT